MEKIATQKTSENAITQEEVDKTVNIIYESFSQISSGKEFTKKDLRRVNDDGHHLTLPSGLQIKTVFHSVDVCIEDMFGGKFTCSYEIKPTVEKIADYLKTVFPKTSEKEISEIAEKLGESYEKAKNRVVSVFAERIFSGRLAIGRFFHNELEEILKIVIADLISDAELFALSQFEYKLVSASEFDKKSSKMYEKRRKERVNVISGKGRPQGTSFNQEEFEKTVEQIEKAFQELEAKKRKITKNAVAGKLYVGHSNPGQQLNRFFKRYDFITFDKILQDYRSKKEN